MIQNTAEAENSFYHIWLVNGALRLIPPWFGDSSGWSLRNVYKMASGSSVRSWSDLLQKSCVVPIAWDRQDQDADTSTPYSLTIKSADGLNTQVILKLKGETPVKCMLVTCPYLTLECVLAWLNNLQLYVKIFTPVSAVCWDKGKLFKFLCGMNPSYGSFLAFSGQ